MKLSIFKAIILFLVLLIFGCKQDTSTSESSLSGSLFPGDNDGGGGVTLNASIYGSVSSGVVQSNENSAPLIDSAGNIQLYGSTSVPSSSDTCSYSSYNSFLVGGDGTAISSGTALGGFFAASVNADHEVILEFDCGMKCLGKPGSTDLVCDLVANAVINALENSLGSTIKSDPLFDGLSIAKISEGISESLKLMSTLDPTNSLTEKLESATTAAAMESIISASSLGPLFSAITTAARERKAYNQAILQGKTPEQALEAAAAASWTVERVTEMIVGIGLPISFGLDGSGGIYSPLFAQIDTMIGIPFVSGFKTYVKYLYAKIYDQKATSSVTLVCKGDRQNTDYKITYKPYYKDDGNLTCQHRANPSDTDEMDLTTDNGTVIADGVWLYAEIRPSSDEKNRNDPTGVYSHYHGGLDDYRVNVISAYQEFMDVMTTPNAQGGCGDYVTIDENEGGPTAFDPRFFDCIASKNLTNYFAGLLGVYKFMRSKELRQLRFSLDDIYQAMVGTSYMSIRPQINLWEHGLEGGEVRVSIEGESNNAHINPYFLKENGTDGDGRPKFLLESPGLLAAGDVTTDMASYLTMLNAYKPSYKALMSDFEQIPSMAEIKYWIFKSSHFVPYNPAGSRKLHVMGNVSSDPSSDDWIADTPIMCKINNPNAVGDFISGTSSITCDVADATTWNSDGEPENRSTYSSNYALQERGGGTSTGQSDRFYGLLNINNGTEYTLNGRQVRIRGIRAGYTDSGETVDNRELKDKTVEFCHFNDAGGQLVENCWKEALSYVVVEFPYDESEVEESWYRRDYWPYTIDIPMTYQYWDEENETTVSESFRMAIARDADNNTCCLSQDDVTTDATNEQIVTELYLGNLVDCFDNSSDSFYYLTPQWGADSTSDQYYDLIRNDGLWMWADPTADIIPIALTALESASGKNLGPENADYWMNNFQIANLGHKSKFDPYCDDVNNNGQCDCTDDDGDGECTLEDTFTEPTISDPPYWSADPSSDAIKDFINTCKGKEGESLYLDCMKDNSTVTSLGIDWNSLLECKNSSKTLSWVDVHAMVNDGIYTGQYGKGCGISSTDYMGEVRMKNLRKRRNAYDVERPNKMLKLISSATATIGTGVSVGRYQKLFNFQEALALTYLRLSMPMGGRVYYDSNELEDTSIHFQVIKIPGRDMSLANDLLRKFLEIGGVIDPASQLGVKP